MQKITIYHETGQIRSEITVPQIPRIDEMLEIDGDQCRVTRVTYKVENGECVGVEVQLI